MANAYGGALAYALSHIHGSIAPWQILFIIEGLPTVCISVVAWFVLPDSLAQCNFLSDRERQIAAAAVARNQQADPDRKSGFHLKELLAAFKEPKGGSCLKLHYVNQVLTHLSIYPWSDLLFV